MIRFLRIFSNPNFWRPTQYSAKRLCFNKSDDLASSLPKTALEKLDTSLELAPPPWEKRVDYNKYLNSEYSENIIELIAALPENPRDITMVDVLNFYDNIKRNYVITHAVVRHPKFNLIRKMTETHLLQFNTKELTNVLIAILPSKALMNDKLSQMIIDVIVQRANHLPFSAILFTDFILHKYYSLSELNKDYSILRLTLQRLFLSKIDDALNDVNDFEELMKMVAFCNNNVEVITPKIANLISTSLLLRDDEKFTVNNIISCLSLLASFGKLNDHVTKLLAKMIELWSESEATAYEVRNLLRILVANKNTIDKEQFNDLKFIRHCVTVVTSQTVDRELLFSVQNELNRLDFTSHDLIEYLSKYFHEDIHHFNVVEYIIFCTACAKADYKPSNWDEKILPTLKTFKFDIHLNKLNYFDWAVFVFQMDKLGHCDTRLIHKILKSKHLQSQKWYNPRNVEKLKEILNREGASVSDFNEETDRENHDEIVAIEDEIVATTTKINDHFYKDLVNMFGANKISTNVRVEKNLIIPYVLKMDLQSGEFLPITTAPSPSRRSDELLMGIVFMLDNDNWTEQNRIKHAKKQVRRIEQNVGMGVIILNEKKWNGLKAYEKGLVFYTKTVNMMDFRRKNKLKQLITDV